MAVTLNELKMSEPILNKLLQLSLPISLAYKVNKLVKLIQPELEFYNNQLNAILAECAVKTESGEYVYTSPNTIKIAEDRLDECQTQLNELNAVQSEFSIKIFSEENIITLENCGLTLTPLEVEIFSIFM